MHGRLALGAFLLAGGLLSAQTMERKESRDKARAARAMLVSPAGSTVASSTFDPSGRCTFSQVPPGEYKVVLTSEGGRTVTLGDLDGDGRPDLYVAAQPAQDFNTTRSNKSATASPVPEGPPGQRAQDHNSSRSNKTASVASGLPTGQRMHKPFACVVGWDGKVKGPFSEAAARASATGAAAPPEGACVVKVHCPSPSTVQIESWSFGASPSGR